MPKLIDRVGEIHDTWKVVEKLPSRNGKTYWRCICRNCGAEKEIQGTRLSDGKYAKCNCSTSSSTNQLKVCQICGKTFSPIIHGETRKYCFECSPQVDKDISRATAITAIRRAIKKRLVEYKGGKCELCGYNKCIGALQFHHSNPEEKDFDISKVVNSSSGADMQKLYSEVDKCLLLCSNCHAEQHWLINEDE